MDAVAVSKDGEYPAECWSFHPYDLDKVTRFIYDTAYA